MGEVSDAVRFNVVTIFPEMLTALACDGVIGRAIAQNRLVVQSWNPRDYANNPQRKVDDVPYGGGGGMVMMVQPLFDVLLDIERQGKDGKIIYLTPQGKPLDQKLVNELAHESVLTLVAGRYEGFDERIFTLQPGIEISIGDFVVSGGELPAMLLIDAVARQLPGVVGSATSVYQDSFMRDRLDYPQYTRPREFAGCKVPELLVNGHHCKIDRWRRKQGLLRTQQRRPDLLLKRILMEEEQQLLDDKCLS